MRVSITLLFGAALLAASTAVAQQRVRDIPTDARAVVDDRYPARKTPFPNGVTGLADVVFSTVPGYRPLTLDLYLPRSARARPAPLVIYVHGGGWTSGHTRHAGAAADFPKALALLASEGFVVASLEYRLAGEAPFPAQLQDVRAAIRYLKNNAGKYGIDPARVGIWGGSAGGHLAALAALSCGDTGVDVKPQPAGSECVQAAAIWYGVFDFAPIVARPNSPAGLIGCKPGEPCPADKIAAASPLSYIDKGDPPVLLIHGTQDRVVPVDQSQAAFAKLRAAGVPVEQVLIDGVDHSFIGKTPAATRAATLRAFNLTYDFLHRELDRPRR